MKTILLPTDFSSCSEKAAQFAIGLAKQSNAKIIVMNSYHVPALVLEFPLKNEPDEKIYKLASAKLDRFIENNFQGKNIKVEKDMSYGLAADSILSVSEKKKADLIVMGTKGSSGIEEVLLGSIASSVMEKSHCPILVVPKKAKYAPFKKIMYATDYKEKDFKTIRELTKIASLFKAEIMIVHISDSTHTDEYERDLFRLFSEDVKKNAPYEYYSFHFQSGIRIADSLNAFMEHQNADVLSLSTRKKNFISAIFDKSLAKKLVCHTTVPMLVFHLND